MVAEVPMVSEAGYERAIVRRSFRAFLPYVKILEPPPNGGEVEFQLWPHLIEMADALDTHRLIAQVKAKQIGASWEAAGRALWMAQYNPGAVVPMYSKGERESKDLLAKSKYIYDRLPPHLQTPLKGGGNVQELVFPAMDSRILALPSTKDAGIGIASPLVIMDEADFHEYLGETYDIAAKPTIDAGGGLWMLSTINPATIVSPFRTIVQGAGDREPGENGFALYFYPYDVRPGRDQAWYDAGLAASLDPAKFQKNYPRTLREALAPSQVMAAFDLGMLDGMQLECKAPIRTHGTINIYQEHVIGHRYGAASDPSHGTGGDDAVTVVKDFNTGGFVADIQGNDITPEQLAFDSVKLLGMYDNPIWAIEDNDWGILVIRKAQELEYPNLYERSEDNAGWHTGEHNRYMVWGGLMEAVLTRSITVYSKQGLAQFVNVIKNPEKDGRIEAMQGTHDDFPMACGIAGQMEQYAYNTGIVRVYDARPGARAGGRHSMWDNA